MQKYSTLKAKLIYVFTIPDVAHSGCVKVGEATLDDGINLSLQPNSSELNKAAKKRIDQYTKTAGITYNLRHTELAFSVHGGFIGAFNDKDVHNVLLRSGIKRHDFSTHNQGSEWFECSVETAVAGIQAVKEGRSSIKAGEIVSMPADRALGSAKTVRCPFFGEEAAFPSGPFTLAQRRSATCFAVFVVKERYRTFRAIVEPLAVSAEGTAQQKMQALAHAYAACLEKVTRAYPDQWFNFYDFWE